MTEQKYPQHNALEQLAYQKTQIIHRNTLELARQIQEDLAVLGAGIAFGFDQAKTKMPPNIAQMVNVIRALVQGQSHLSMMIDAPIMSLDQLVEAGRAAIGSRGSDSKRTSSTGSVASHKENIPTPQETNTQVDITPEVKENITNVIMGNFGKKPAPPINLEGSDGGPMPA